MESLRAFDLGLLYFLGSLRKPWLDPVVRFVTAFGEGRVLAGVVLTVSLLFAWRRRFRLALVMLGIGAACGGLLQAVRAFVDRPRPEVAWRQIDLPATSGFPSWHAMGAMGIYLGAALLGRRLIPSRRWRVALVAAAVALALAVGLSRPYLGVHYPLDVVEGWLGGLFCALVGEALADSRRTNQPGGADAPSR